MTWKKPVDNPQNHLRKAIHLFEDRLAGWNKAHPVQSDLVNGLVQLEKLATAATRKYRNSPMPDPSRLIAAQSGGNEPITRPRSPAVAALLSPAPIKNTPTASGSSGGSGSGSSGGPFHLMLPGSSRSPNSHNQYSGINTPLSLIRGFPDLQPRSPNPQAAATYVHSSGGGSSEGPLKFDGASSPLPFVNAQEGMASIGLTPFTSNAEAATLPQVRIPFIDKIIQQCKLTWISFGQKCLASSSTGIRPWLCSVSHYIIIPRLDDTGMLVVSTRPDGSDEAVAPLIAMSRGKQRRYNFIPRGNILPELPVGTQRCHV